MTRTLATLSVVLSVPAIRTPGAIPVTWTPGAVPAMWTPGMVPVTGTLGTVLTTGTPGMVPATGTLGTGLATWTPGMVRVRDSGTPPADIQVAQTPEASRNSPSNEPESRMEVLSLVPRDAWVLVTAHHLAGIDAGFARLLRQLNLPFPLTPSDQLYGLLGILEGLDTSGDAALVVMPPEPGVRVRMWSRATALILPTNDLPTLLAPLAPTAVDDTLVKITVHEQPAFAAQTGRFAVISMSGDVVRAVIRASSGAARAWTPAQRERFQRDDVSVWVNVSTVLAAPRFAPLRAALERGASGTFIRSIREVQVSLRLTEPGLFIRGFVRTTPRANDGGPTPAGIGFTGLPAERCIAAAAMKIDPATLGRTVRNLVRRIPGDPSSERAKALARITDAYVGLLTDVDSVQWSLHALPDGSGGLVRAVKIIHTRGASEAWMARLEAFVGTVRASAEAFGPSRFSSILKTVTYARGAERVGETPVDHLVVDVSVAGPDDRAWLDALVDADGVLARVMAVDDARVLIHAGGGADRARAVLRAIRAGEPGLAGDPSVVRTSAQLGAPRFGMAVLYPDRLATLIVRGAQRLGRGAPSIDIPDVGAPVGAAAWPVGTDGGEGVVFVPVQVLIGIKDVAVQAMARKLGGPATPPPPEPSGSTKDETPP